MGCNGKKTVVANHFVWLTKAKEFAIEQKCKNGFGMCTFLMANSYCDLKRKVAGCF